MKYFPALIMMICFVACTSKKQIEGSWIYCYGLDESGNFEFEPISAAIFDFKNDSINEYILGNQDYGIANQHYTYNLIRDDKICKLGDRYILDLDSVNGDSLILKSRDSTKKTSIICKKLPYSSGQQVWNPMNKVYRFNSVNSESIIWDFVNDSALIELNQKSGNFAVRKWGSAKLNGYPLMIITHFDPIPILIDSIVDEKVFASYFESSINRFTFELEKPNEVSKEILGLWTFSKLEPIGSSTPAAPINKMSWINITRDSLEYEVYGLKFKAGWRASNTGKFITSNSSPIRFNTVWKVDSISKKKLVLELRDEINQRWRLIYNK
ncbi:hypothetical protein [Flagellimonas meishanensis]|uniref:hypothetical protein n=1 Tax=Flagellimonas meishanensis TaxID=2873264 RepID=UPI001CA6F9E9|nr:hypothetical protein [[Muricauda] meishanensis]